MRKLLALLFVSAALLFASSGSLATLAQAPQDEGADPDGVDDLVPCCDNKLQHRGARPEATEVREIREPGAIFADEATMARLAEEGRRRAPIARELEVAGPTTVGIEPLAPRVRKSFNGLDIGQGGGFVPPDTALAVGPEHILQAVNVAIRLSDKSGKNVIVQTGEEHFGSGDFFDPKVHYDPASERFFIVLLDQDEDTARSKVFVSVSRSSTPESLTGDDWCSYSFKSKKKGAWADYPGLGVSGDWVTIATNNFGFGTGGFSSAWLWVMDKAKLVDNVAKCPTKNKVWSFRVGDDDDGVVAFTLQPAQHLDTDARANGDHHVVASQPIGFSDQYGWWTISRKGKKPKLSSRMVEGAGYSFPPSATQKGSEKELDTIGHRLMQQVTVVNGQLWLAHTTACRFGDSEDVVACIRVERFAVDGLKSGFTDLFGVPGGFLWVPGIAVSSNGDVVTTFQMTSAKLRLSTGLSGMRGGATRFGPMRSLADEFDAVKAVFKGKCPTEFGDPEVRTGDYIGAASDPSTDDVWISGEFGAKVSGLCGWNTKIGRVSY